MQIPRFNLFGLGHASRQPGNSNDRPPSPLTQRAPSDPITSLIQPGDELVSFPPPERWDDWVELDPTAWPNRVARHYQLLPTTCSNCEAGCGLLAYVDQDTLQVRKFEGNPLHPGSRGRICARGPATLNQTNDPERILYPHKRVGPRGSGQWERTTWDEVLDTLSATIRTAILAGRSDQLVAHSPRSAANSSVEQVLRSWGGPVADPGTHLSAGDYTNARLILLISTALDAVDHLNPTGSRTTDARLKGARLAVIDPLLSNLATLADRWLAPWPGTEPVILLAIASYLLRYDLFDRATVQRWTNWEQYLREHRPDEDLNFDDFIAALREHYARYTFEYAATESGVRAEQIEQLANEIAGAGPAFVAHFQGAGPTALALELLSALTGSIVSSSHQVSNRGRSSPEPALAQLELGHLLPYFLKEGTDKLALYLTRTYNPVWSNPDGASWIEVLRDESKIGLHACLSPTWNETARLADYVLPIGHAGERHEANVYESQLVRWLGFGQPVTRLALEKQGHPIHFTYESNPGEVWEEQELFIELVWRIDPAGSLGLRKFYESPFRPGEKITIVEHYQHFFENSVPGLPDAAAGAGLTPLAYMQKYGAFQLETRLAHPHEQALSEMELFALYSRAAPESGWPGQGLPSYLPNQADRAEAPGELTLLIASQLPTSLQTSAADSRWLAEIAHANPLWIHPSDAARLDLITADLVKVNTEIGYFITKCWVTDSIRPGLVACSREYGHWRLQPRSGGERWSTMLVELQEQSASCWRLRQIQGPQPWPGDEPDSARVWWTDAGVPVNLALPIQPDPRTGLNRQHYRVRLEKPSPDEHYGDIFLDTDRSLQIYREFVGRARPADEAEADR